MITDKEVQEFLSVRKEAGLKIDPATAEVDWEWGQPADPYGIRTDLSEEAQQVGRVNFARSPGGDIWVSFGDLPDATIKALWARLDRERFVSRERFASDDLGDASWLHEKQNET